MPLQSACIHLLHSERMERGVRRVVRVLHWTSASGTLRSHVGHHAEWGAFRHGDQCDVSRRLDHHAVARGHGHDDNVQFDAVDLAAQNDVHNWTPSMPLHMRYCTEDEEVWFQMQSVQTIGCLHQEPPMWKRSIWVDSITMAVRCQPSRRVSCGFCQWNRVHLNSQSMPLSLNVRTGSTWT